MSQLCIERGMTLRMSTVRQRPVVSQIKPTLSPNNIYISSSEGMSSNYNAQDLQKSLRSNISHISVCEDIVYTNADDNNNNNNNNNNTNDNNNNTSTNNNDYSRAQCQSFKLKNHRINFRSSGSTIGVAKTHRKNERCLKSKLPERNNDISKTESKCKQQKHIQAKGKLTKIAAELPKMQRKSLDHSEFPGDVKSRKNTRSSPEVDSKLGLSLLNDGCPQNIELGQPLSKVKIKRLDIVEGRLFESHKIEELVCSCKQNASQVFAHHDESYNLNSISPVNLSPDEYSPNINEDPHSKSSKTTMMIQHKLVSLGERNGGSICNKHMPWFGIDVGGSLIKVVFFDPKEATREEMGTLKRIRRYLKSTKPYGETGKRDAHLEMPNCVINKRQGTLHFIRFATNKMPEFLLMAKNKRFADTINTVCATGGGAYKFEDDIRNSLGITLHKSDELDSIIYGIHYIDKYNFERECYYLRDPLDEDRCVKVPYDFSRPYPYLVVNIGSGVSILAVYSSTSYSRISGSSIGGGTFLGLCCLLTECKTFDEAIRLAKAGSSTKIDKLVKDIYGGDYPKFNLSGDTVASSFGHMNIAEKRQGVKREDLARALLEMVTINIGSIARMCAANENIDRVVFIGNFLRVNQLSMKLLSYAVNYWSQGAMKALFLEHEGYFGAVGCFVESTQGCHH